MILVNNKPLSEYPKDDPRVQWFNTEFEKIQKKKDLITIKKIVSFRLTSEGRRVKPPRVAVQSRQLISRGGSMEMWACCETYAKEGDNLKFKPNFYYFDTIQTLDPRVNTELIFYLTCIVDLGKLQLVIDNPEFDAKQQNEKELAELDVKYAIQRKIDNTDELRSIAASWGVNGYGVMGIEQLKKVLFETVRESEKNKLVTKKGYKEFMDDVFQVNPEVTEARALVTMALDKGVIKLDRMTRKWSYTPTGDTICIVPLENKDTANDFLAETLLKDRNLDLFDTLKQDVFGVQPEVKLSIADIDGLKTRDSLKRAAKRAGIIVPPAMKDETIRRKLVEKVSVE